MRLASLLIFVSLTGCIFGGGGKQLYNSSYYNTGGVCGVDEDGDDAKCFAGDRCDNDNTGLCEAVASECDDDLVGREYDSLYYNTGAVCGVDEDGDDAKCFPGDLCDNAGNNTCVYVTSPCIEEE